MRHSSLHSTSLRVTPLTLLAPDVILLGGGMAEAMPDLLTEEIDSALKKHLMPSFKKSYEIRVATLEDDAGITGAAAWAQENFASGDKA